MTETKAVTTKTNWTSAQAYAIAAVCLLVGVAVGWLFRGSQSPSVAAAVNPNTAATSSMPADSNAQPTPEQMKKMADTQVAPLLQQLKSDSKNVSLLTNIGNVYYDTQQFPDAITYYQQALQLQPENAGIRTDMATAYWYTGNADTAITEFNKALTYEPNKPNTLFNLGMVKWQGKMDINGAVACWQKLLETNPNYEGKEKVQQMIAEAKKHSNIKPGASAKAIAN